MAFLRHQSTSSDHEHLLRDYQGQENDHERQEEDGLFSVENEKTSEDGGEKEEKKQQCSHIYPWWLAGRGRQVYLEDIKSEHQDHQVSVSDLGDTKAVSPYQRYYYYSVPLLDDKVRRFVFTGLTSHLPTCFASSFYRSLLLNLHHLFRHSLA